jgi:hypothetical protein
MAFDQNLKRLYSSGENDKSFLVEKLLTVSLLVSGTKVLEKFVLEIYI